MNTSFKALKRGNGPGARMLCITFRKVVFFVPAFTFTGYVENLLCIGLRCERKRHRFFSCYTYKNVLYSSMASNSSERGTFCLLNHT